MKIKSLLTLIFLSASVAFSSAQVEMPAPSPAASVSQTVGVTKITIDYSSPGVKGRDIWGGLLAYDVPWRAGANSATKINFSKDVTINGKDVKAGSYSVFVTPSAGMWTFHISSGGSIYDYEKDDGSIDAAAVAKDDVVSIKVKPTTVSPSWERLRYLVDAKDNETGSISLVWADKMVSFDVAVNGVKNGMASIDKNLKNWYTYSSAAEYYANNGGDLATALKWANMGADLKDHFFAHWVKAQVLAKMDDNKGAKEAAKMALSKGEMTSGFFKSRKPQIEALLKSL